MLLAFFKVTVRVEVAKPSARIILGLATIVELVVLAGATKLTVVVLVPVVPFKENPSVAVVIAVVLVKVAV